MTREILFRGKRTDTGEWVFGTYHFSADGKFHYIMNREKFIGAGSLMTMHRKEVNKVCPPTIGQFTGLHDKDGNKIFEGDVLLIGSNELGFMVNGKGHPARYIVKHEGCDYVLFRPDTNLFWGRLSRIEELCWGCEIIDNIHDNPELLNP